MAAQKTILPNDMMRQNISIMNKSSGFSVVIVCCSSKAQARYWQKRLEEGRGSVLQKSTIVLSVEEDWPGGAGNALGTFYAFQNAEKLASSRYGIDISSQLKAGSISVGLYHTAGKGTRLAPLPGAENNNKPGVKLPVTVKIDGKNVPMTILEAVIKQTGCYANSRPGRLSVFWGDQIFIPTANVEYNVAHHVDILCSLGPMPSAEEWIEKGNQNYGLVACAEDGRAAQVEKVDHATATKMLSGLGKIDAVGPSLGSFSLSSSMLFACLDEFAAELEHHKGKLDSDPHLWMPMTLELKDYLTLMAQKGVKGDEAEKHYNRIQRMMQKFDAVAENGKLGRFGPVDVGQDICWWDFGLLRLYQRNVLLMSEKTVEADLMKYFFNIGSTLVRDSTTINTDIDSVSLVASSHIGVAGKKSCGTVRNSVLCNVRCRYIEADGCILINVTADSIIARPGCIVYNIVDESEYGLDLSEGQVLSGVFADDGSQTIMRSATTIDGGKAWSEHLEWNPKTFEDVYKNNANADPIALERVIAGKHKQQWGQYNTTSEILPSTVGGNDYLEKRERTSFWMGVTTGVLGVFAAIGISSALIVLPKLSLPSK
jgi:hypothetical protein